MRLPTKSLPVFREGGALGAGLGAALRCHLIPTRPLAALASTLPEDGEGFFYRPPLAAEGREGDQICRLTASMQRYIIEL